MADADTSRANVLVQRAGCAVFLVALAVVGFVLHLEHLGLAVNINQGWNALGTRSSFVLDPDRLRPGQKPAIDSIHRESLVAHGPRPRPPPRSFCP